MQRFLVFLLLLLVSVATLAPCCRYDDCASEHATAKHEDQDKGDGACSPFFACASCPGFVATHKPLRVPLSPPEAPLRHVAREAFAPLQYVYRSFWQPPKNA
ncbi:MAG: hypothetical protein EOO16_16190 [Chitinophagaceae bacterium]|nr:MAG: hypothetical protein EOO16_16190 [Chitinophagaceae bacterium]